MIVSIILYARLTHSLSGEKKKDEKESKVREVAAALEEPKDNSRIWHDVQTVLKKGQGRLHVIGNII